MCGNLCNSIGPAAVVPPGQDHLAGKGLDNCLDAVVIGCNHYARNALCPANTLDNALDHRPTGDRRERFAGEARRGVARRDDSQNSR
jgi:hypothetical protein